MKYCTKCKLVTEYFSGSTCYYCRLHIKCNIT